MKRIEHDRGLHGFACLTAAATVLLIVAGGLVTSTGSGLAVPDWPLSYGTLFPPMVGGVFYEHGHRLIAGTVALMTLVVALWAQLREPRRWVRRLAWTSLATVIAQAVLGGLTVLFLLPTSVSVAHACLAQSFLCMTVALALVTSRRWKRVAAIPEPAAGFSLRTLGIVTTLVVFAQLAIGALMRHTGAGLAISDFPLSFGHIVPPVEMMGSRAVLVNFAHRVGALCVVAVTFATAVRAIRHHVSNGWLLRPALLLPLLVTAQVTLGAMTVWSGKAVVPSTAHVATGALILATALVVALRAARGLEPARVSSAVTVPAAGRPVSSAS